MNPDDKKRLEAELKVYQDEKNQKEINLSKLFKAMNQTQVQMDKLEEDSSQFNVLDSDAYEKNKKSIFIVY